MNIIIDSSVFISTLGLEDTFTSKSKKFFSDLDPHEIFIPTIVIAETLVVISKQGNEDIESLYSYLLEFNILSLDTSFITKSISMMKKNTLKTNDFLILSCAYVSNATLITWDEQLLKQNMLPVSVKKPHEFV